MFVRKILQNDVLRKKSVTIVVFAFMLLAAWLAAGGANLIVELSSALNTLFVAARVPHFVQMHAGEIDQAEIDRWAASNSLVEAQQTVEMLTVDGSVLSLGTSGTAEENSIMDISIVRQNAEFDFLLDLDNRVIQLAPGEIAVPIYYMQRDNLKIGDPVRISLPTGMLNLTIAAFARDAQMNPAVVHSKRFLVHAADYATLSASMPDKEYLIEFLLTDADQISEFSQAYLASGLPKKGPTIDYQLFKTLNALTDGIAAGVVIVLSLLLLTIAILCLRFTMLATIEEDYKEIGVMKAIGIAPADIKRIYLSKYLVMGGLASLFGYLAALAGHQYLAANIAVYLGRAPRSLIHYAVPAIAAAAIALIIVMSCMIILRRFNRISAVEALRSGTAGGALTAFKRLRLAMSRILDVNIFLGLRDVAQRFRMFGLLCFVFFFCAGIMLVPVHFLTTMTSPTIISYMGIGKSDIRIDLRQSEEVAARFEEMLATLAEDDDVARFTPLVTSQFKMVHSNGEVETLMVESGDFSLFPLDYVHGAAPRDESDIALSMLNAQDMDKQVGDSLTLLVNGQEQIMTVSGIYQDVTNGGRTAKAVVPFDPENVLWYTVSLDLLSPERIAAKVHEYAETFYPARITDLEGYVGQTLGNTIEQLRKVTLAAVAVGLLVAMLMTALFLKMLIARDASQIAIMKGLGFSLRHIRIQYLTKAITLLVVGILLGTVFSNTLGQRMVSVLWSFMGASRISFVIDPALAYLLLPLLMMAAVAVTTLFSITGIKDTNILNMINE